MIREWFSLDGIKCNDYGIAMLGYKTQPLPDQVVNTLEIPGMHGAYDMLPGTFKQFRVVIQCAQLSEDEIDLTQRLMRLKTWAAGKRKLMLWDREGIEYDARLSSSSDIDNQVLWGEFTMTFIINPPGYGVERSFPIGVSFDNSGNCDTPCIVKIKPVSPVEGITVLHAGGSVKIYNDLIPTQMIVIDSLRRFVTIGGVNAMLRVAIEVAWPVAIPGSNAIVTSHPTTGEVSFRERWV